MARTTLRYWCRDCGTETIKWQGQCPGCAAWNTLDEIDLRSTALGADAQRSATSRLGSLAGGVGATDTAPQPIGAVEVGTWRPAPTGLGEADRVLGGGLVAGSVTLLGGEPGIGKSTLALQVAGSVAARGDRVLYVCGEESAGQVRSRADRLGVLYEELWLTTQHGLDQVVGAVATVRPTLVVLDSIQTCSDPDQPGVAGSVNQVRAVVARLVGLAKQAPVTVLLVGHVTKEGQLAGPRVVEHLVDTVVSFEGDRHHALRLLRAVKHRFGATGELGVFEMTDTGLVAVGDPSALFLADRVRGLAGSSVVPTLEGHRPLLVEVQALTSPSKLSSPRRSAHGVDAGRLNMLLAVLLRRCGQTVADHDVYALAVGGARVVEPGADLGLALAVASAANDRAVPGDLVACGEVGLAGEVRRVAHLERRLAEAARLGFARALVPAGSPVPDDLQAVPVATLGDALDALGIEAPGPRRRPGAAPR
jgi:DNA repair protein RadA/Sms